MGNLPPGHRPVLFYPRVATAGECKCHPALPVNYSATKQIVCLVHTERMRRSVTDEPIVSTQMLVLFLTSRIPTTALILERNLKCVLVV